MRIINIPYPEGDYNRDAKLDEGELSALKDVGVEVVAYTYAQDSYDGTGIAVWKAGDQYGYDYLGHCSCDGPTSNLERAAGAWFSRDGIETLAKSAEVAYKEVYETILNIK